jgi:hypothetical protein
MRIRRHHAWRAVAVSLLLAAVGFAGYMVGKPGADLDAIRSAANAEGREAGAEAGAKKGYARGYRRARERTYVHAYSAAYREAYTSEFEVAGLDPPQRIQVPEPR